MNRRWLQGQLFSIYSVNCYHILTVIITLFHVLLFLCTCICLKSKTFSYSVNLVEMWKLLTLSPHPKQISTLLKLDRNILRRIQIASVMSIFLFVSIRINRFSLCLSLRLCLSLPLSWHWYTRIHFAYSDSFGYKQMFFMVSEIVI